MRKRYPSDLTDEQWEVIRPLLPQAKPGGRLTKLLNADPPLSNEKIVDALFLATLSRHPSASEQRVAITQTEKYRNAGAEDVLWGLVNKLDFIFNY